MRQRCTLSAILIVFAFLRGTPAATQDLEPRAYVASPIGTTFLVVAFTRSSGSVFLDPSLQVTDVRARLGALSAGAGYTFGLFTRTALVVVAVPFVHGTATGRIEEAAAEASRTGFGDLRAKMSINLLGGRALRPAEFAKRARSTIVGVSLSTIVPTGQYDTAHLINIGTHRWSFKPEVGVSVPFNRWTFDGYAGVWLFTANDEFFPGTVRRTQDPISAIQGHVSYTLRPRMWLAFDATWYSGGTTSLDGVSKSDLQRNSRAGVLFALPLGQRQSVKFAYSTGATTRIGGDFDTVSVAWQMSWLR